MFEVCYNRIKEKEPSTTMTIRIHYSINGFNTFLLNVRNRLGLI